MKNALSKNSDCDAVWNERKSQRKFLTSSLHDQLAAMLTVNVNDAVSGAAAAATNMLFT